MRKSATSSFIWESELNADYEERLFGIYMRVRIRWNTNGSN